MRHFPSTKAASAEGEDVYWASQQGDTDPTVALQNHFRINSANRSVTPLRLPIKGHAPHLTKTKFLERVRAAARTAGLEPLQAHGIRIGSTFEYLLQGMPFDVMKTKGQGADDAFQLTYGGMP